MNGRSGRDTDLLNRDDEFASGHEAFDDVADVVQTVTFELYFVSAADLLNDEYITRGVEGASVRGCIGAEELVAVVRTFRASLAGNGEKNKDNDRETIDESHPCGLWCQRSRFVGNYYASELFTNLNFHRSMLISFTLHAMRFRVVSSTMVAIALAMLPLQAQLESDYRPLRCAGPIPDDFLKSTLTQFEVERETLEQEKSGKANRKEKRFLMTGSYATSRMLTSGLVIFGDPLTTYCNEVMDELLRANPDVRHNVRVYVVKSSEVNAFATDQGIIFVTVGLLSKLNTEAQLAFILGHELVHHLKKHSIDLYFEKQDIQKGRGQYRQYSVEDRIMKGSIYNKEKEKEADLLGYEFFSKTPYAKRAAYEAMDLLEFSHTPFADSVFHVSFFESSALRFPDLYKLDTVQHVEGFADKEGETHPSIAYRKEYLLKAIGTAGDEGRDFILSEEDFRQAMMIARFELCRLYLLEQDYGRAIYNCYLLLKQYPDNKYLRVTLSKGLTGLATYATANDERDVLPPTSRVEGELQRLYFLLNTLTEKGLTVMALVNNHKLLQQYPDDSEVQRLFDNSIRALAENYDGLDKFVSELPADYTVIIDSIRPPDKKEKVKVSTNPYESKVTVRSALSRKERKEMEERFLKYALVDIVNDPFAVERFAEISKKHKEEKKKQELKENNYARYAKLYASEIREELNTARRGYRMGSNVLIIVNPAYIELNYRRRSPFKMTKSIEGDEKLQTILRESANTLNLRCEILDPVALNVRDAERFNDMGVLSDWYREQIGHQDKNVLGASAGELEEISGRYGSDYALWLTVVKYREHTLMQRYLSFVSSIILVFTPAAVYGVLVPRPTVVTLGTLYNLQTGEEAASFFRAQSHHGNPGAIPSSLHDILWQVKSKSR